MLEILDFLKIVSGQWVLTTGSVASATEMSIETMCRNEPEMSWVLLSICTEATNFITLTFYAAISVTKEGNY